MTDSQRAIRGGPCRDIRLCAGDDRPPTFVSICTGVAGLDVAIHRAIRGIVPLCYVESRESWRYFVTMALRCITRFARRSDVRWFVLTTGPKRHNVIHFEGYAGGVAIRACPRIAFADREPITQSNSISAVGLLDATLLGDEAQSRLTCVASVRKSSDLMVICHLFRAAPFGMPCVASSALFPRLLSIILSPFGGRFARTLTVHFDILPVISLIGCESVTFLHVADYTHSSSGIVFV